MTEPTDAEIRELAATGNGVYQDDETAIWEITDPSLMKLARAALTKWGQPAQAQAGAVPLTCEWAHNEDDGFWDTECGQSWRFDDGGPKENHMNFCHCCGKPLRIKGGQHG